MSAPTPADAGAAACGCHSAVAAKLARLAAGPQSMADLPLDAFLAASRDVVAAGMRVLDCASAHAHDQVLLPVLLAALLLHLVCIYDLKIASLAGRGPHAPSLPVRLSLGSYQLEGGEAQAVHASLLQMDLSKIRAVLDAVDERFCGPSVVDPSAHAAASLVACVKRRLRASLDAIC
ncbi:hypothetical protein UCRNP2_7971 [Neofusicoccum parvum UCRNP2]|uniref:Uncharacterized protein n=1 Tax=Botryosphaeria parva (strain UCR-NP2) TaxID=1287680 RepID=R1EBY1_BOTPV|nr:hypothetical protein UCRNP2_7971 [Neofusicoccum parvum UCRNP2]